MKVAVVGASGYAGSELLRLMAAHPHLEVVLVTGESAAGKAVGQHVPSLSALYPTSVYAPTQEVLEADIDAAFIALPHGASQQIVPALQERFANRL